MDTPLRIRPEGLARLANGCTVPAGCVSELHARRFDTPACSCDSVLYRVAWSRAQAFSTLVSRRRGLGHAIRRSGCEMRAPILDQPVIAVAGARISHPLRL